MHPENFGLNNITYSYKGRKFLTGVFFPVLFFLFGMNGFSQTMEVGLFGGGSYYIGDLNPSMPFVKTQIAYGVLARYNLDERWAVKLGITRGKVKGNSANSSFLPDRQLQFESPVTDISAVVEFNFFKYFTGSKHNWVTPYIFVGVGAFFYAPEAGGFKLRDLGTEGQTIGYLGRKPYSSTALSIPFGVGVKMSLTKRLAIGAYWEMHKTFIDYLDDVSTTYYLYGPAIDPNVPDEFYSDPAMTHEVGMQRGNPKSDDWFSFAGITLTYRFDLRTKKRCRDLKH